MRSTLRFALAVLASVAASGAVLAQLGKLGLDIVVRSADEANKYLQDEARSYAEGAKRAGVRPE